MARHYRRKLPTWQLMSGMTPNVCVTMFCGGLGQPSERPDPQSLFCPPSQGVVRGRTTYEERAEILFAGRASPLA